MRPHHVAYRVMKSKTAHIIRVCDHVRPLSRICNYGKTTIRCGGKPKYQSEENKWKKRIQALIWFQLEAPHTPRIQPSIQNVSFPLLVFNHAKIRNLIPRNFTGMLVDGCAERRKYGELIVECLVFLLGATFTRRRSRTALHVGGNVHRWKCIEENVISLLG